MIFPRNPLWHFDKQRLRLISEFALHRHLPCRNPCAAASTKDNDAMRPCHTAAAERPPLGFVAGAAARLCDERADTMIHPSALSQDCGGLPWLAVPMAAQAAQEAGVRPYRVQIRPASGELCRIGCKLNRKAAPRVQARSAAQYNI